MENVISARRLRKSMLNNVKNVDIEMYDLDKGYKNNYVEKEEKKEFKIGIRFKNKIILKFCICCILLFSIITGKMFFKDKIKEIPKLMRLYSHYQMDFSKTIVLDKFEYQVNNIVMKTGNIVPEKIRDFIQKSYVSNIKPYIITFSLKDSVKNLFNSNSVQSNNNSEVNIYEELTGIGGGEPLSKDEKEVEFDDKFDEAISAVSIMDTDIEAIRAKNINIISPLSGVITSKFGAREEIFNNVDPYHTGTDIAAKKGTNILSATKGKVTKVEHGNKYYGNYVEITEEGIVFKYAHMETIAVKVNEIIEQKHVVGTVGSTGMSTGPHLHFEIKIDGRVVDAQYLVTL